MKVFECDRCGQRLPMEGRGREARWLVRIGRPGGKKRKYHICGWCHAALLEWSLRPLRRWATPSVVTTKDVPGQQVAWEGVT